MTGNSETKCAFTISLEHKTIFPHVLFSTWGNQALYILFKCSGFPIRIDWDRSDRKLKTEIVKVPNLHFPEKAYCKMRHDLLLYSVSVNQLSVVFSVVIPSHAKSGGVLCYTLRKFWVSVHPSVRQRFASRLLSGFDRFLQTLWWHWYRGGVVWVCKWAIIVHKQHSYGPWFMW